MTDIYVPSKSHLFTVRFHSSASSSLVTFSQFVTPWEASVVLFLHPNLGFFLELLVKKVWILLLLWFLVCAFGASVQRQVRNLEAQGLFGHLCCGLQENPKCWFLLSSLESVDDYFILVELQGTSDLISTLMILLVSRNGCLEHLATMSCTLLRSWVKWLAEYLATMSCTFLRSWVNSEF